jgi:hypothetical protein
MLARLRAHFDGHPEFRGQFAGLRLGLAFTRRDLAAERPASSGGAAGSPQRVHRSCRLGLLALQIFDRRFVVPQQVSRRTTPPAQWLQVARSRHAPACWPKCRCTQSPSETSLNAFLVTQPTQALLGGLVAGDRLGCADRFDELGDGLFGKVAGDVGFADYAQQPMTFDEGSRRT